ncbi:MAG TPA: methyltransferase [Candidatus Cloacimonadota bacterium]|nr:methyltransferase [Candidatus Cloacimonadota bacterium]HOQ79524.1 methyltransferase [Candidatus Cloacimonadota bacterium]HPK40536.1 methyltransferase [Candidatus Cloacimonadota bacterium]
MKAISIPETDLSFYQMSNNHQITSDTAFLSETIIKNYAEQNALKVLDIGTGMGIIAYMLKLNFPDWQIDGIDIQESLITLAKQNLQEFCLAYQSKGLRFLQKDLRKYERFDYDLIVSNPPYYKEGQARLPEDYGKAIARHEITLKMDDILQFFAQQEKQTARLLILYPAFRDKELQNGARQYNLAILNQMTVPDSKANNQTFLYEIEKC